MNPLVGKKVIVFSDSANGERQDVGTIESIEGIWMCLKKAANETLYFCVYNVRVIKIFEQQ